MVKYRHWLFIICISTFVVVGCSGEHMTDPSVSSDSKMREYIPPAPITKAKVEADGAKMLTTDEIKSLIVGKMITIKHLPTGNELTGYYNEDGTRTMIEFDKGVAIQGGKTTGASRDPYRIEGDQLHALFEGGSISTTIYQLNDRYLAAVGSQNGEVNYEVFPPGRK